MFPRLDAHPYQACRDPTRVIIQLSVGPFDAGLSYCRALREEECGSFEIVGGIHIAFSAPDSLAESYNLQVLALWVSET